MNQIWLGFWMPPKHNFAHLAPSGPWWNIGLYYDGSHDPIGSVGAGWDGFCGPLFTGKSPPAIAWGFQRHFASRDQSLKHLLIQTFNSRKLLWLFVTGMTYGPKKQPRVLRFSNGENNVLWLLAFLWECWFSCLFTLWHVIYDFWCCIPKMVPQECARKPTIYARKPTISARMRKNAQDFFWWNMINFLA